MTNTVFDEFLYDTIQVIIILEVVSLINLHTSFLDYLLPESINDSLIVLCCQRGRGGGGGGAKDPHLNQLIPLISCDSNI